MRKINSIIFDLDGTLVYFKIDFMTARREIIQYLISEGVPGKLISENQSILTNVRIVENFLNSKKISPEELLLLKKNIDKIISKYELEGAKKTSLFPEVSDLLQYLSTKNYKLGLFTLENREITNFLLERFNIKSYFTSIVTRDDVGNCKPNPEHLETVLSQLKMSANEVLVVGDNPIDLECARRINAVAIGLYSERHSKSELKKAGADYVIKNFWELRKILKKLNEE